MTARRRQPSSIDRLPNEVRELIGALRQKGRTLDEILGKLRELDIDVSRSALGRHCKSLAEIGEQMRRSREVATALVDRFGDQPDDKLARLNIELMHGVVFETLTAATAAEENADGDGKVTFSAGDVMFLSKALGELARAQKTDADRIMRIRQVARAEAAREAAEAVKSAAGERGLSADTADFIMKKVLGVAA